MVTDIRSVLSPQYYSSSLPGSIQVSILCLSRQEGGRWEVGRVESLVSGLTLVSHKAGSVPAKKSKLSGNSQSGLLPAKPPPSPPPDNPGESDLIIGATLTDCELTQAIVKSEERGLRWVWRSNLRFNTNNLILNRAVIYGPSEGLSNSLFFTYLYSYPPQLCRELF